MVLIAPSLLAADFARLGEALRVIKEAGATMVHVDVMDGHFVPEISVGQPVVKSLRKATDLVLDVHLLIERPERFVGEFIAVGADRIAVHSESTPNLHKVLEVIRKGGRKAGVAINPSTAVESVRDLLQDVDYLLILSSDAGFGDSTFLPQTLMKVRSASSLRRERHLDFAIQVEGTVGPEQIEALAEEGADILVAGSDIFQESPNTSLSAMIRQGASTGRVFRT